MKKQLTKMIDVKSIVTLVITVALIWMLIGGIQPNSELLSLYCTTYGAVITYFFTKKNNVDNSDGEGK